jgi:hypothetical protein
MAAHAVAVMAAAGVACWVLISLIVGPAGRDEALYGMLGPLAVAIATWILVERTHARSPERVAGLMIRLFGAKLVFFGVYVALVVVLLPVGPGRHVVAFVASFTCQYILLHLVEALYLRRLFSTGGEMRVS